MRLYQLAPVLAWLSLLTLRYESAAQLAVRAWLPETTGNILSLNTLGPGASRTTTIIRSGLSEDRCPAYYYFQKVLLLLGHVKLIFRSASPESVNSQPAGRKN